MKYSVFFIFLLALVLISTLSISQSTKAVIAEIRKEINQINSGKTYKKLTLRDDQISKSVPDGGVRLTCYRMGNNIRKIVSWIGLSTGNRIFEYYYENNKLIFVYDTSKQAFRLDTTERTFEGRYYFKGDRLIDYKTTGHNRFEDDEIDPQKTLLSESDENRKLFLRRGH